MGKEMRLRVSESEENDRAKLSFVQIACSDCLHFSVGYNAGSKLLRSGEAVIMRLSSSSLVVGSR